VENEDPLSLFYDLKWTTKVNDVNFDTLKPHQLVNHFNNNACLTSKYGICKSLRSIMFSEAVDIDSFFPKAFDISDLQDFENFLEVYKWVFCESKLKKMVEDPQVPSLEEQLRFKVAFVVTSRRLLSGEKLLVNLVNGKFNLCAINEWRFMTGSKECSMDEIHETLQQWEIPESEWEGFKEEGKKILEKLGKKDPQFRLNGSSNIWIVKPACTFPDR
jgi:tubulin monoglycylase TTLL3/8